MQNVTFILRQRKGTPFGILYNSVEGLSLEKTAIDKEILRAKGHWVNDTTLAIPTTWLLRALESSLTKQGVKVGTKSKAQYVRDLIEFDPSPLIPLKGKIELNRTYANIGASRNMTSFVEVKRPLISDWVSDTITMSVNTHFDVNGKRVFPDVEEIRALLQYAGKTNGIGSFRPQNKGMYGMFEVDKWRVA
jgi:hypothetical protein